MARRYSFLIWWFLAVTASAQIPLARMYDSQNVANQGNAVVDYLFDNFGQNFTGFGTLTMVKQTAVGAPACSNMAVNFVPSEEYYGCVNAGGYGRVLCIPYSGYTGIGVYNWVSNTFTRMPGVSWTANNAFLGATVLTNGMVFLSPYSCDKIRLYNPIANTYTNMLDVTGPAYSFSSSCLLPSGKVLLCPGAATGVGIYDPDANTLSTNAVWSPRGGSFAGAVVVNSNKVVLIPNYNQTTIGIYNPITDTYSNGPSVAASGGNPRFDGGCLMPNGKVFFCPNGASYVGIYDPVTDTYSNGPAHGVAGGYLWTGCALMPNGDVVCTPTSITNVLVYHPTTETITLVPTGYSYSPYWQGAVLMPNGNVFFSLYSAGSSTNFGVYYGGCTTVSPTNAVYHPMLNRY